LIWLSYHTDEGSSRTVIQDPLICRSQVNVDALLGNNDFPLQSNLLIVNTELIIFSDSSSSAEEFRFPHSISSIDFICKTIFLTKLKVEVSGN